MIWEPKAVKRRGAVSPTILAIPRDRRDDTGPGGRQHD